MVEGATAFIQTGVEDADLGMPPIEVPNRGPGGLGDRISIR